MISRHIILGLMAVFFCLIGYSIAQSLKYGCAVGFILAITSLGATIYFIYLLIRSAKEQEKEESA